MEMKFEWKKQEKEIYGTNTKPCVIDVPAQKYIIISGGGNPNDEIFSDKVATLFSVAYKIKIAHKSLVEKSCEITDYSVYPLGGIWSKTLEKENLVKKELQYRIMIRQPDFITREMFDNALEVAKSKEGNPYLIDILLKQSAMVSAFKYCTKERLMMNLYHLRLLINIVLNTAISVLKKSIVKYI